MMKKKSFLTVQAKLFVIGFIAIQSLLHLPGFSQTTPSLFVVVDYMKVESENHEKYLEVEQEIWKPLHQERINQGIIVGWYLYAIEFSGTQDNYNYVAISMYDSAKNLENPWNQEIPENVHPNMKINEILDQTFQSRENVKSELFYSIATAPPIPLEIPASYLEVNFMQVEPEKFDEYELLESEIWLPIHNESIQSGRTAGWGLWRSLFPRGAGQPYQYITLNSFSKFSYVFQSDFSVPFKNIHPAKNFNEVTQKTQRARTIMRTELWNLIDYAIR
jgi:hypothetical protein